MARQFHAIERNIKTYLKSDRVASFVNAAASTVAKQAVGRVGSVNGQPAPYVVYRDAPFVRGGSMSGNEIGPPRFYVTHRTGRKRHRAMVTYSHPTPKGRLQSRQALQAASHMNLADFVDGQVIAQQKSEKKWQRKNKRLSNMSPEKLQARADKRAARARRKPRRKARS